MDVRAAVAFEAGQPLQVETVRLDGPKAGEVMVEIKATGICHTDAFTLSGADPEGLFPTVLGHEGAGVVVEVGAGVTSLQAGDHVIPLYAPECRQCPSCLSRKTNLCTAIRSTQGKGLMPDGSSRFSLEGRMLHHYMGCSTFANFTVLPEIAVAKIRPDAPFDKVCYIGCGVTTRIGAVLNTAKEVGGELVPYLVDMTKRGADQIGGADYTFDCTGNVTVMRQALEACHRGWGESIIIGVAGGGQEIATRPFQLVTGRVWRGSAFGGARGRSDVPKIVDWYMDGKIEIDPMITHTMPLAEINSGFALMREGKS